MARTVDNEDERLRRIIMVGKYVAETGSSTRKTAKYFTENYFPISNYTVSDYCNRYKKLEPALKDKIESSMKENKPITILLYEDDLPKLCEIRCINCSRMLCKVNAHVKSISFGDGYDPETQREMVSGMNVVEQKCRGCDCIYKFLFQK